MPTFRCYAQAYTSTARITKLVQAVSAEAAMRAVAGELEAAGYYLTDVRAA